MSYGSFGYRPEHRKAMNQTAAPQSAQGTPKTAAKGTDLTLGEAYEPDRRALHGHSDVDYAEITKKVVGR